jgi:hypothetical protein
MQPFAVTHKLSVYKNFTRFWLENSRPESSLKNPQRPRKSATLHVAILRAKEAGYQNGMLAGAIFADVRRRRLTALNGGSLSLPRREPGKSRNDRETRRHGRRRGLAPACFIFLAYKNPAFDRRVTIDTVWEIRVA